MDYKNSTDSTTMMQRPDKSSERRPIRILHVVGGMNVAGVETTLMHMLRRIDRDRFKMDFLVHTERKCPYDDEIRSLGSQVIPCLNRRQPWIYAANFRRIMQNYDPYDIIHCHVHHFDGYVLRLAEQSGIPVRIAHSRNNTSAIDARAGLFRRWYLALMKKWILRYATFGLASSRQAAACLFGSDWEGDPRWQIFVPARDLNTFPDSVDPTAVRDELGIPPDALVIGHVGRFSAQKNHHFMVEIAAEIAKRESKMRFLFVGDGLLRPEVEQKVAELDLTDKVIFTGVRSDVPRLMLGAMNIFLFPSLHEGLGSVGFEAQAQGLPCVFSDVIPEELDVVEPLVKRVSLSKSASQWAEELLAHRNAASIVSQTDALALVKQSPFNLEISLKQLEKIYDAQFTKNARHYEP